MTRSNILEIINYVMQKRGRSEIVDENVNVRDANFRSLDFSEVALRIENEIDRELIFDAATMRQINTVKDVIDFFETATET